MSNVTSHETFLVRRAQTEARQSIAELQRSLGKLQQAFRPLNQMGEALKARLDRAIRWRESEEEGQRDLQRSFEAAFAAASLSELEAARDSYLQLMAKHKANRTLRGPI